MLVVRQLIAARSAGSLQFFRSPPQGLVPLTHTCQLWTSPLALAGRDDAGTGGNIARSGHKVDPAFVNKKSSPQTTQKSQGRSSSALRSRRRRTSFYVHKIKEAFQSGRFSEIIDVYKAMQTEKVPSNLFVYNHALSACANLNRANLAHKVYNDMRKDILIEPDAYTYATLFNLYARATTDLSTSQARILKFKQHMRDDEIAPNKYVDNAMLNALQAKGLVDEAFEEFDAVVSSRQGHIDSATVTIMMKACLTARDFSRLASIVNLGESLGVFDERAYEQLMSALHAMATDFYHPRMRRGATGEPLRHQQARESISFIIEAARTTFANAGEKGGRHVTSSLFPKMIDIELLSPAPPQDIAAALIGHKYSVHTTAWGSGLIQILKRANLSYRHQGFSDVDVAKLVAAYGGTTLPQHTVDELESKLLGDVGGNHASRAQLVSSLGVDLGSELYVSFSGEAAHALRQLLPFDAGQQRSNFKYVVATNPRLAAPDLVEMLPIGAKIPLHVSGIVESGTVQALRCSITTTSADRATNRKRPAKRANGDSTMEAHHEASVRVDDAPATEQATVPVTGAPAAAPTAPTADDAFNPSEKSIAAARDLLALYPFAGDGYVVLGTSATVKAGFDRIFLSKKPPARHVDIGLEGTLKYNHKSFTSNRIRQIHSRQAFSDYYHEYFVKDAAASHSRGRNAEKDGDSYSLDVQQLAYGFSRSLGSDQRIATLMQTLTTLSSQVNDLGVKCLATTLDAICKAYFMKAITPAVFLDAFHLWMEFHTQSEKSVLDVASVASLLCHRPSISILTALPGLLEIYEPKQSNFPFAVDYTHFTPLATKDTLPFFRQKVTVGLKVLSSAHDPQDTAALAQMKPPVPLVSVVQREFVLDMRLPHPQEAKKAYVWHKSHVPLFLNGSQINARSSLKGSDKIVTSSSVGHFRAEDARSVEEIDGTFPLIVSGDFEENIVLESNGGDSDGDEASTVRMHEEERVKLDEVELFLSLTEVTSAAERASSADASLPPPLPLPLLHSPLLQLHILSLAIAQQHKLVSPQFVKEKRRKARGHDPFSEVRNIIHRTSRTNASDQYFVSGPRDRRGKAGEKRGKAKHPPPGKRPRSSIRFNK